MKVVVGVSVELEISVSRAVQCKGSGLDWNLMRSGVVAPRGRTAVDFENGC